MLYRVTHTNARARRDLGVFYPVAVELEADTPEKAEAAFVELYESGGGRLEVREVAPAMPSRD